MSLTSVEVLPPALRKMKVSFQSHNHHIEKMAKALNVGIGDQTEKMPSSGPVYGRIHCGFIKTPVQPWLMDLIKVKGFMPQQDFNAEETGFFWKRMPSRTFLSKPRRSALDEGG